MTATETLEAVLARLDEGPTDLFAHANAADLYEERGEEGDAERRVGHGRPRRSDEGQLGPQRRNRSRIAVSRGWRTTEPGPK